jgi:hypothetical protein
MTPEPGRRVPPGDLPPVRDATPPGDKTAADRRVLPGDLPPVRDATPPADLASPGDGPRDRAAFAAEIRAALRYEAGLAVKAVAVLAVLALILVLRAMYFSLPADAV